MECEQAAQLNDSPASSPFVNCRQIGIVGMECEQAAYLNDSPASSPFVNCRQIGIVGLSVIRKSSYELAPSGIYPRASLSYLRRTVQIDRKSGIIRSFSCFLSGPGSVMRFVRSYVLIV
jgi:hypothetical protein